MQAPFADATQRLAEVGGAAHERHGERPLVDVVGLVGRGEHFALVDVVDAERLEDLRLHEVADASLGHHRDGDRGLDALDHLRVAHAGHAAVAADVGRHTLERHHGAGAGVFGDLGLLGVDDVHDDAALHHLGEATLDLHGAGRSTNQVTPDSRVSTGRRCGASTASRSRLASPNAEQASLNSSRRGIRRPSHTNAPGRCAQAPASAIASRSVARAPAS
jgi:hypothetical protein